MVDPKEPDGGDLNHGLTANGIIAIITAIFLGLTQLTQIFLTYQRENAHIAKAAVIAAKVEEVAAKQDAVATEHTDAIASLKRTIVSSMPTAEASPADSNDK